MRIFVSNIRWTGFCSLTRLIPNWPGAFKNANVLSLLCSTLHLLANEVEGDDRLDWAATQQPPGPAVTMLTIGSKGFLFGMEVVAPKDAGQRLWEEFLASVFPEQVHQISSVDFRVVPG